jgi:phosphate butyryltransferase
LFSSFEEIREAARGMSGARVAVPMGHDSASLEALVTAAVEGLADSVIIAPVREVEKTLESLGLELPRGIELEDLSGEEEAALRAVSLVREGRAGILMKGLLKTSTFLKAVLDDNVGLRSGGILSHVAMVHVPRQNRLVAITDGGMNIRPDIDQAAQIIQNAAWVMRRLGAPDARAALLAAIESPSDKMPETILWSRLAQRGVPGVFVDGPMAVDGAMDPEAAEVKGMSGEVAGRANILVTPDIASGNIFAKAFMYMTDAQVGGMVAGATAPVVMLSRSDVPATKLNSLALGVVVSRNGNG